MTEETNVYENKKKKWSGQCTARARDLRSVSYLFLVSVWGRYQLGLQRWPENDAELYRGMDPFLNHLWHLRTVLDVSAGIPTGSGRWPLQRAYRITGDLYDRDAYSVFIVLLCLWCDEQFRRRLWKDRTTADRKPAGLLRLYREYHSPDTAAGMADFRFQSEWHIGESKRFWFQIHNGRCGK